MSDISELQYRRVVIEGPDGTDLEIQSDGSIKAHQVGVVSSGNSSTTPLGASSVFTGSWEEVKDYSQITVFVKSNQAGATDGLSIQFSLDGSTVDDTDVFTIPANAGKVYTFGPSARYFRVVYTNGAVAQGSFRLQTVYRYVRTKPSSHRLADSLTEQDDAELVKAVVAAVDVITGNTTNIQARDNRLLVSQDVVAPPGTTEVISSAFGAVATTSGVDTYYTITNGLTLTIQSLTGGSEENTGGSVIDLFYDPNANLTGMTRLGTIYVNGSSDEVGINQSFIGNGTRRIVLRRRGFSANSREMAARWSGFEE